MTLTRKLFYTDDGSASLKIEGWDEQYHSKHGAVQESQHVYIKNGLQFYHNTHKNHKIRTLEIGLGTALNAYLTALYASDNNCTVDYTAIEAYPLKETEWKALNYDEFLKREERLELALHDFHLADWGTPVALSSNFSLTKLNIRLENFQPEEKAYNLIYFDAFGFRVQPELWTTSIFKKMHHCLDNDGVLVTYAAKGSVRRDLQSLGFVVERLPGPPGKREMLRAIKS